MQVVGFAGAGGDDGAFGFAAEDVGPVGGRVEAGAEVAGWRLSVRWEGFGIGLRYVMWWLYVRINEVDADKVVLD